MNSGHRYALSKSATNSEELLVIVALSGGGTRAAAFSAGALEGLRDTTITWKGREIRLLDEVDIISSVSGGSFAAAYYGLYRNRLFDDFSERFLYKNVTRGLALRVLNPINWFRLASPNFDRIHLAAEYHNAKLFDRRTFRDMQNAGRSPFIVMNATDMASVSRFEFTQAQFDLIGSDLDSLPVATAVTASSAFPILLSPITLKNYSPAPGVPRFQWIDDALSDRETAPREYANAFRISEYLDGGHPYVHLLDGGLADNIGLRGPVFALTSHQTTWSLQELLNTRLKHLVVVTVNAKPLSNNEWDRKENAPGIPGVLGVVVGGPLGNYSNETVQYMRDALETIRQDNDNAREIAKLRNEPAPELNTPEPYFISVSFEDVPDPETRKFLGDLPTTFNLSRKAVDTLKSSARDVFLSSPDLKRLREKLAAGEE